MLIIKLLEGSTAVIGELKTVFNAIKNGSFIPQIQNPKWQKIFPNSKFAKNKRKVVSLFLELFIGNLCALLFFCNYYYYYYYYYIYILFSICIYTIIANCLFEMKSREIRNNEIFFSESSFKNEKILKHVFLLIFIDSSYSFNNHI